MRDGRYQTHAATLDGAVTRPWVVHVDVFEPDALSHVSFALHQTAAQSVWVAARVSADGEGYSGVPFAGDAAVSGVHLEATGGALPLSLTITLVDGAKTTLRFTTPPAQRFRDLTLELAAVGDTEYARSWVRGDGVIVSALSALADAGLGVELIDAGAIAYDPGADLDPDWDDIELHDAMLTTWKRADASRWYAWALAAPLHEDGRDLCGLMFEGGETATSEARFGVAVFSLARLHRKMSGGAASLDDARRNQVFTLIHELGHSLNLAHSWEKTLDGAHDTARAWPASHEDPAARSWMNYPHLVPGFWDDFGFRFIDEELRFIRHAPEELVAMGGVAFLSNNALEARRGHPLAVEVVGKTRFGALEPVRVSVRVRNTSLRGVVLGPDEGIPPELLVARVREDGRWRPLRPYTRALRVQGRGVIQPGESRWGELFLGAEPRRGAVFDAPGTREFQVFIEDHAGLLGVSEVFKVEVDAPRGEERALVGDFRSEEMSRLYAFEGSNVIARGESALARSLRAIEGVSRASADAALQARLVGTGSDTRPRRVLTAEGVTLRSPKPTELRRAVDARQELVASRARAEANPAGYARVAAQQVALLSRVGEHDAALRTARDAQRVAVERLDDALATKLERVTRRARDRSRR